MSEKLYAERDIKTLWPYYIKHISAMTGEGLHDKADIASELAYRDDVIERKDAAIAELRSALKLALKALPFSTHPDAFEAVQIAEKLIKADQ